MIFVEAVIRGVGVAAGVITVVTAGATVVKNSVGTAVGREVFVNVGTSVGETGVVVIGVTSETACCVVHPLAATSAITSRNNPSEVFMKRV